MKLNYPQREKAFTLTEVIVASSAGAFILAAIVLSSVTLQRSYNASDNFFAAEIQQVRIIDYLSRDVRRSYIVSTSADKTAVTCIIPNYLNGNMRSAPTVTTTANGTFVSYPGSRSVMDAITTNASTTLTSATANFTGADVGTSVSGVNIAAGTVVQSVTNSTTIILSNAATATGSNSTVTFGASTVVYSIVGNSILRTENGTVTNIASSTDGPLTQTNDVTLSNTEFTTTTVQFLPIFTSGNAAAEQTGTTVYATTYLRNKRRG